MFARTSVHLTKKMGLFCGVWTSHYIQFTLQDAKWVKCEIVYRVRLAFKCIICVCLT